MVEGTPPPQQPAYYYAQALPAAASPAYGQPVAVAMTPALSQSPSMYQHAQPVAVAMPAGQVPPIGYPGYRTMPPKVQPQPGQVIIGWEGEFTSIKYMFIETRAR